MSGLTVRLTRPLRHFALDLAFVHERGILALFGQSGMGKTQTLECLAGLAMPQTGVIALDDRVWFRGEPGAAAVKVPPHRRGIGYVVQDGALFPHMTLAANVAYGIRREPDAAARVRELLAAMGISELAERYPREVSGGQQRRAAIARALAIRPRLLLLDEPFVHLDRLVRARLMRDLVAAVRAQDLLAVLVTHDREELAACADRIALLERGRIIQLGARDEVLDRPVSAAAALLLGDSNLLDGTVAGREGDWWVVRTGALDWRLPGTETLAVGQAVTLAVRASALKIIRPDVPVPPELARNCHPGRLLDADVRPDTVQFTVRFGDGSEVTGATLPDVYARAAARLDEEREFAVVPGGLRWYPRR